MSSSTTRFRSSPPKWGGKRKAYRKLWKARERAISKIGDLSSDRLHADRWLKSRLSPDSDLELNLDDLRNRSQELYAEFGVAQGAIEGRVDNVVGPGIPIKAAIKETGSITARTSQDLQRRTERGVRAAGPLHRSERPRVAGGSAAAGGTLLAPRR